MYTERLLSALDTLIFEEGWLEPLGAFPQDLQSQSSDTAAAQRLQDRACYLQVGPGFSLQYFYVQFKSPGS